MQTSKLKQQQKIKNPYTLRTRFFDQKGQPREWSMAGTGQFIDIQTVQRQIRLLKANYPNKTVEVEFKMNGKLLGFNGEETGTTMIFKRRDG